MTFSAKIFISVMPDKHCDEIPFRTKNHYLPSSVSLFIILTPRGEGGTPYNSLYGRSPPKRGGLQSVKGSCVLRRFF